MSCKVKKYLGGPGTGKTFTLLNELDSFLNKGYKYSDICFITFQRATAKEVREKIKLKFNNINKGDLYLYSTQHSICYKLLKIKRNQVVSPDDRFKLCKKYLIEYLKPKKSAEILIESTNAEGNKIFSLFDRLRSEGNSVTRKTLILSLIEDEIQTNVDRIYNLWKDYLIYKRINDKLDFVDMLQSVIVRKLFPPVKILLVDEFQDFGELQYKVFEFWKSKMEYVTVVGDDDQSIFGFMGNSPKYLINLEGETIVLKENRRNPHNIYEFAKKIISKNKLREQKQIVCLKNGGKVERVDGYTFLSKTLKEIKNNANKKFILARTNYYCRKITDVFLEEGVPFRYMRNDKSPYTPKFKNIFSVFYKIKKKTNINPSEIKEFILSLKSKGLLIRGVKKQLKEGIMDLEEPMPFVNWATKFFSINCYGLTLLDFLKKTRLESRIQKGILRDAIKLNKLYEIKTIDNFIGTFHSSKGLEASEVYIFDTLPSKVSRSLKFNKHIEAERRLYYTALTRTTQKEVLIHNFFDGDNFLR